MIDVENATCGLQKVTKDSEFRASRFLVESIIVISSLKVCVMGYAALGPMLAYHGRKRDKSEATLQPGLQMHSV